MIAKDLGTIEMQPTRNDEGTMIYYRTDKGYGVHIDATNGKLIQVNAKSGGAVFRAEGYEDIDEESYEYVSLEEAFRALNDTVFEFKIKGSIGRCIRGRITSYESRFDHYPIEHEFVVLSGRMRYQLTSDDIEWVRRKK